MTVGMGELARQLGGIQLKSKGTVGDGGGDGHWASGGLRDHSGVILVPGEHAFSFFASTSGGGS